MEGRKGRRINKKERKTGIEVRRKERGKVNRKEEGRER